MKSHSPGSYPISKSSAKARAKRVGRPRGRVKRFNLPSPVAATSGTVGGEPLAVPHFESPAPKLNDKGKRLQKDRPRNLDAPRGFYYRGGERKLATRVVDYIDPDETRATLWARQPRPMKGIAYVNGNSDRAGSGHTTSRTVAEVKIEVCQCKKCVAARKPKLI